MATTQTQQQQMQQLYAELLLLHGVCVSILWGASLPRTKVKMPRSHLVESAAKVMDHLLANSRSSEEQPVLEVEFAGEEGVGQGPTNEFYAEVLEALLSWKDPELFLNCSSGGGLFPRAYLTDISLVPVEMLRRPRASPLVQQQQRRLRRRANASRTDRATPTEGAEDMEEDVEPSSSNNSSNSAGGSPPPEAAAAAGATAAAAAAAASGKLERQLFSHFRLLGQLAAKALVDGRSSTTDTGLHALFWEAVARPWLHQERLKPCNCMNAAAKTEANAETAGAATAAGLRLGVCSCGCTAAAVAAVAAVDGAMGRSLQQMLQHRASGNEVKDLCCSFVVPRELHSPAS
ncbi:uncharacterized protein EMH_0089490 [Eimeria mitis]|uniref:HECT domain-containing protein n=1 Tax=Eimeria mitis TaxID=44415 RepID=U6K8J0_9EIME|nr:uncharacterized protein EMH_0089490 [Eimeria mitis]CDJ34320.1 hypothetical protein EMH_0089490 [Eimeria mitis]